MRVIQLNIDYRGTGADRCARELFECLPSVGVDTNMLVRRRQPDDPEGVRALTNHWERFLAPLEIVPDLTDWRHLGSISALDEIQTDQCDLVHIHNIHSGWISVRAVHSLARRMPCVWTLHDEWAPNLGLTYNLTGKISPSEAKQLSHGAIKYIPYHRYHDNFKWRRTRSFLGKWLPQPRVVICPSRYMLNLVESSGVFPGSRIVHLHNGTRMPEIPETRMEKNAARNSLGLNPDSPVLLMASVDLAQAHKGVGLGIEAIKMIERELTPQVLLLGKSGDVVASRLSSSRVVAVDARDDATMARAYRAADVTLIPSLGENFPYVALESLACRTPIIAFAIGGMPEIIGDDDRGLLCRETSARELCARLQNLFIDPEMRRRQGESGADWVHKNCDMARYLSSIKLVYESVS